MLTSVEGDVVGCDDLYDSVPSMIVLEGEVVATLMMLLYLVGSSRHQSFELLFNAI